MSDHVHVKERVDVKIQSGCHKLFVFPIHG